MGIVLNFIRIEKVENVESGREELEAKENSGTEEKTEKKN